MFRIYIGIHVSLEFFDDIFIPCHLLPQPSEYDSRAKLWVWKYEASEEGGIFSMHEQIRFRIESISFTQVETTTNSGIRQATTLKTEQTPSSLSSKSSSDLDMRHTSDGAPSPTLRQRSTSIDLSNEDKSNDPPLMQITASVNDHGLGLVCWNWE